MHSMLIFIVAVVIAGPSRAQVDPVQQCVWACLYGVGQGDPASPAYNQCVNDTCVDLQTRLQAEAEPVVTGADRSRIWQTGKSAEGIYAGIDAPGREGEIGLYFICRTGNRWSVSVVGLDGGAAPMRIVVDGTVHTLEFRNTPGWPEADLPPQHPLVQSLRLGQSAQVQSSDGRPQFDLSLTGSASALAYWAGGC